MPDRDERHLALEQDRRDAQLGPWWCEGQTTLDDHLDPDPDDAPEHPLDVDDCPVCAGDVFLDDNPPDHPPSRRIDDVPLTGDLL